MGHPLPQVLQRGSQETRYLGSVSVFGGNRTSGKIAAVKIIKIGAVVTCGGVVAVILGAFLGAGSCNATGLGVMFLMLGLAAAPLGVIMLLIGLITKVAKKARTAPKFAP